MLFCRTGAAAYCIANDEAVFRFWPCSADRDLRNDGAGRAHDCNCFRLPIARPYAPPLAQTKLDAYEIRPEGEPMADKLHDSALAYHRSPTPGKLQISATKPMGVDLHRNLTQVLH